MNEREASDLVLKHMGPDWVFVGSGSEIFEVENSKTHAWMRWRNWKHTEGEGKKVYTSCD